MSADVHHTEGREKEQQDSQQLQDIASLTSGQAVADDGFGGFKADGKGSFVIFDESVCVPRYHYVILVNPEIL